ncbi:CopG family ribbon-helix-helix protein [Rhizobium sp. SL86]|jgi:predicted transcriptional regulator|uniref:CopG family ribbon-helix-helix protein n=1 Tax=Rhizobium sp. SL86 TaxID=2995148 RepID=UPI002274596A|nr:CopG family ribbon-helix-helix protein [Rhizobium sp. SL86]MCY1666029.1 CopG family ribbon-helix-helix protein [Rhizobium sp. SL86]
MRSSIELSEDLDRRLERLSARSQRSRSAIIEDALSHGRSLDWQERWIAGVQAGLADADEGKFATEAEIADVLNKYGPA